MTLCQRAAENIPEENWNEIIEEWKKEYPDYNTYVRLKGGSNFAPKVAETLNFYKIPYVWINSFYTMFFMNDPSITQKDLTIDPPNTFTEIRFASLPESFKIVSDQDIEKITFRNGMIYVFGVPIPVLKKMYDMGISLAR